MRLVTVTYTAPSAWASYWINADPSGLEDDEISEANEAFASICAAHPGAGPHPVDCEDAGFMHSPDFGKAGDCQTYTFMYPEKE